MIALSIYGSIFKQEPKDQELVFIYASRSTEELELEAIANVSMELAASLAYFRVLFGKELACLSFNAAVSEYINVFGSDECSINTHNLRLLEMMAPDRPAMKGFIIEELMRRMPYHGYSEDGSKLVSQSELQKINF